jgi:hypothetical protein
MREVNYGRGVKRFSLPTASTILGRFRPMESISDPAEVLNRAVTYSTNHVLFWMENLGINLRGLCS